MPASARDDLTAGHHIYRVSFYLLAGIATAGALDPMSYPITVWCALMSAVAFVRGKLWI